VTSGQALQESPSAREPSSRAGQSPRARPAKSAGRPAPSKFPIPVAHGPQPFGGVGLTAEDLRERTGNRQTSLVEHCDKEFILVPKFEQKAPRGNSAAAAIRSPDEASHPNRMKILSAAAINLARVASRLSRGVNRRGMQPVHALRAREE